MVWRETTVWLLFGALVGLITGVACEREEGACIEDGVCFIRTPEACEGTYVGGECGAAGSCVLADGTCRDDLQPNCDGGFTLDIACPVGACLLHNGATCSRTSSGDCKDAGGQYQGDGSTCRGSCVGDDGTCMDTERDNCFDGAFELGGSCGDLGSCTTEDDLCGQTERKQCDGAFVKDGVCPLGACVLPSGDCEPRMRSDCEAVGGEYHGDDSSCLDVTSGACCLPEGGCELLSPRQCLDRPLASYHGDNTTCGPDTCAVVPSGGCCLLGHCEELSEFVCGERHGIWQGPDSDCTFCETAGACCRPDGTCLSDITIAECLAADPGASFQPGVACADAGCIARPMTGACCLDQGGCVQVPENGCLAGVYQGDGVPCDGACAEVPTGACCVADFCIEVTPSECADSAGTYLGDGVSCSGGDACLGACIIPNGQCFPLSAFTCTEAAGQFQGVGTSCGGAGGEVAGGRGGGKGVAESSLPCAKSCMNDVSLFLASCSAQGNDLAICASTANRLFQRCLEACAPGCDKDCMTESSAALAICIAGGTPLDACLGATQSAFGACLASCPAREDTDCLGLAAAQLTDCLLAGGDPSECGQRADALITGCLEEIQPPAGGSAQLGGDCNQDGSINVADVTCIVRLLFRGFHLLDRSSPELPCTTPGGDLAILDVSGNQAIDVADIVALAGFLFGGGAPPPGGAACQTIGAELGCPQNAGCR